MAEPIQTTRMRRLPTVFGVFTIFSDDIPDVKRFAQVNWLKSLTLEGKCFCRRAKPAHIGGHLPAFSRSLRANCHASLGIRHNLLLVAVLVIEATARNGRHFMLTK